MPENERSRPAADRAATDSSSTSVPTRYDIRRARRIRVAARRDLDALLGVGRTDHATIDWDQFALGIPARNAAGIALRERAA
jgi:hypothetical protein